MAQYYWTAEDYADLDVPSDAFSGVTGINSFVIETSGGRKRMRIDSAAGRSLLRYILSDAESQPNVEIWMKYLTGGNSERVASMLRASDTGLSTETQISARDNNQSNNIQIIEWDNGSASVLATSTPDPTDLQINESRFSANSTDLKYRWWAESGSEPALWEIETPASVTQAGNAGIANFDSTSSVLIYEFGVGTNGDSAPTAPVTPPSGATVEPTLSTTQATAPDPSTATGASVTAPAATTTAIAYSPATAGGASISATVAASTQSAYTPIIATGAQVSPSVANSNVVALFPAISAGASVSTTAATTTTGAADPTVTAATTTTVNPTTANTQALSADPAIATGVVIYPPCFTTTAFAYNPQVGAAASVKPTVAVTATTSADPVTAAGASVQPTVAQSNVLAFVPAVRTGASTTTTAASTLTQSLNPTVVAGIEEYRNKVYLTGVYNREKQLFAHDGRRVTIVGG